MKEVSSRLLETWGHTLRRYQVQGTGNPYLDGGILCPACQRIHGRCFDAMFPFLYLASVTGEKGWICAAEDLFYWAEQTVSQPDGSYLNDIESGWRGTTVFSALQMAECLLFYGRILPAGTARLWRERLKKAADYLVACDSLKDNNINYPITNALALHECGLVLEDVRYIEKGKDFARMAEQLLTENGLVYGEGIPRQHRTARGCRSVDIGYNVEETLPALALYGRLTGDERLSEIAGRGLAVQLMFMLEDGGWDNSFGTRNFKWTYWGSRTSDGCALGYLLAGESRPEFVLAARNNLLQLKSCTVSGLLAGGPHYQAAGQPVCVHHTFTHAKVLAGILERNLCREPAPGTELPRKRLRGILHYPEIDTWLVRSTFLTATVTAYDWEYLPGGHASGGTLSMLSHDRLGVLLAAGTGEYTLKEPANMQIPRRVRHECLAVRIEKEVDGIRYSSLYEDGVKVEVRDETITVTGILKSVDHKPAPEQNLSYSYRYAFAGEQLYMSVQCDGGRLILPLVSRADEPVEVMPGQHRLMICKEHGNVILETAGDLLLPYGTERIFNLTPGFQALLVELELARESRDLTLTCG